LGLNYIGPIDGHNLKELKDVISNLKEFEGPQFLHVITKKGAGLDPAEADRIGFHAIGKIQSIKNKKSNQKKYQDVFGDWVVDMANSDEKLIAITPAMREGSGLVKFSEKFPDRYYDVAIAEQHAVTFAAGIATENKKPVVAIYSTFLQRAYDQLIHDVVLQKLDVTLAIDRAGFVGGDGATHAGIFDVSFLRCIPDIVIMSPSDENECWKMLTTAYEYSGPAAVRYPRGEGPGAEIDTNFDSIDIGKARTLREENSDIVIFSFGNMLNLSEEIANELQCSLIDMRFIKPLDEALIEKCAKKYKHLISIEENVISGGAGSAVNEFLSKLGCSEKLKIFAIPDEFPIVGNQEDQREAAGLTKEKIMIQLNADLNLKNINKEVSA
jgi:1-deoxy-D-xylulose-5-phosphate synthase